MINVFWDNEGPLIAFNRNGSLFCNARYYLAWHDEAVQSGQTREALISWYFSLAHGESQYTDCVADNRTRAQPRVGA